MQKKSGVIFIRIRYLMVVVLLLVAGIGCIVSHFIKGHQNTEYTEANITAEAITKSIAESAKETTLKSENESGEKKYIKWVEFHVTKEALQQAYEYDVSTHNEQVPLHFVELLSYLGAKYGGDFSRYKPEDMEEIAITLKEGKTTMEQLTENMQYYSYYREAYGAVLDGMVGEYQTPEDSKMENEKESQLEDETKNKTEENTKWVIKYGLKAFHPLGKGFPYSDYDDFGASRSYGYKRNHLGHDMMAQVGTPVIAVESGYVAELGWNQYGGWRVGINSFDKKRYYYYAHLRKDFPFAKWLKKGSVVQAGDVIGYVGRTGYSATENVNNIDEYHLHFGLQLIFDESQREGNNQIWVDVYPLVRFLYQNQSETVKDESTKERERVIQIRDPAAEEYKDKNRQ